VETQELARGTIPGVVKRRVIVMLVNGFVKDQVRAVELEQVTVVLLDLVDAFGCPKLSDMVVVWIQYVLDERAVSQLDQLSGQNRQRILIEAVIIAITLRLDLHQAQDQCHHINSDGVDDSLLDVYVQAIVARIGERTLVLDMHDNRIDLDTHRFN